MSYIRTKLGFAFLKSTLAAIRGFRGKWNDIHLQDLTDIDFSQIPRPTIMWTQSTVSMAWHQLYLWKKWLDLISHDILWNYLFRFRTKYITDLPNICCFSCTQHLFIGLMFAASSSYCNLSMPLSFQHHLLIPSCMWLDITHPWNLPHYMVHG